MVVHVEQAASRRLDEIYARTRANLGAEQAPGYIEGMFAAFAKIDTHGVLSRPVPAEFGVAGVYLRCERHLVYGRMFPSGDIGIVTILHARMHQTAGSRAIPARKSDCIRK